MHAPRATPASPPGAAKPKGWSGMSTGGKVLVALALFFGGIFVLGLILMLIGAWWLFRAGDQLSTEMAIGPTSVGYVRAVRDLDDPGVANLLEVIGSRMDHFQQVNQERQLPERIRFLSRLRQSNSKDALAWMWPREFTISREPQQDEHELVAAVNLRRFGGALRALFKLIAQRADRGPNPETSEHRGHTILHHADTLVSLADSTILVTLGGLEPMQALIDRMEDKTLTPLPEPLAGLSARVRDGSDAYGAFLAVDEAYEFAVDIIPGAPETAPPQGVVEAFAGGMDLVDGDVVTGRGHVLVKSPEAVAAVREDLKIRLDAWVADFRKRGAHLTWKDSVDGTRIDYELHLTGFATILVSIVDGVLAHP